MKRLSDSEREQAMGRSMKGLPTQFDSVSRDVLPSFRYARAMKYVNRLAGIPHIRPYDVAIHCFYTAILFQDIAKKEAIEYSGDDLEFVMRHDILETVTGDLLLPAKKSSPRAWEAIEEVVMEQHPELGTWSDGAHKFFSEDGAKLFKACDLLELMMFCAEEVELGNHSTGIYQVIGNCRELIFAFNIATATRMVYELNKRLLDLR